MLFHTTARALTLAILYDALRIPHCHLDQNKSSALHSVRLNESSLAGISAIVSAFLLLYTATNHFRTLILLHLLYHKKVKTFRTIKAQLKTLLAWWEQGWDVGKGITGCIRLSSKHFHHYIGCISFREDTHCYYFSINKYQGWRTLFSLLIFAYIAHHCYTEISSSSITNHNLFQVFSVDVTVHALIARPTSHSLDVVGPSHFWKLPPAANEPRTCTK